jgi:hypothetical protein
MNTETGYIEMYSKNSKSNVRVYSFLVVDNKAMAMIFNPNALPNPWSYVKVNNLVPLEYTPIIQGDAYISKKKRNKAKSRMKIIEATWQTSDGKTWSHEEIESAIDYERELMEKEKDKTNE